MVLLLKIENVVTIICPIERRCKSIKKPLITIMFILSGVIAGVLITSAMYAITGFSLFGSTQKKTVSADDAANVDITVLAYTVLEYIKDEDYLALSRVVHPEFGVVLSPCATINLTTARHFSAEQIAALDTDTSIYVWGVYNGSGVPIELTPSEYLAEFVPAAAHVDAAIIGVNQIVRSGNALENMTDIFPNAKFVDFHIPGEEPVEEFDDWRSLRLCFEEHDGDLKLVAIVFSKWSV